MSTPPDGDSPWQQPGDQQPGSSYGYGQPSSPSYGKYGQGQALPPPPPPPGQPSGAQPGSAPSGWNQQATGSQPWNGGSPSLQHSSKGLLLLVTGLSALVGVGTCLVAFLAPNQHHALAEAYNAALNGSTAAPAQLAPGSAIYQTISPVAVLFDIAVWVTTCLWLSRAVQNARALRPGSQRRADAWVWLGWWVPVANLWVPKQIIDDTINATASAVGQARRTTRLWWTAWVISALLGVAQVMINFFPPNDAVHLAVSIADAVVTAVGLVLWIGIVRWISANQNAAATR